jgi:cytochrome c oxidase cbb3-type subunit 3
MLSRMRLVCVSLAVLVALSAGANRFAWSQTPKQIPAKHSAPVSIRGQQTFASHCASCHGLDGRGGERAPNIAERLRAQRLSDAQLFQIIENGIPGTGMPAFHSLESSNIKAVVNYLRTLQGTKMTVKLPGDPERGETIFFGKAGCSGCHMVAGKGGFMASDLSGYARGHDVEQTRNAITSPAPSGDPQGRMVTATLRGGEKYEGRIRNEDNFSLQFQTPDGAFHFIAKSDLEDLVYSSQMVMPSNYGSTLRPSELNDLVSYLMSVANAKTSRPEAPQKEFEEE